ncbi:lanthionine synthetase C family protein [Streptomyces sp. MAR4 CNY-716]
MTAPPSPAHVLTQEFAEHLARPAVVPSGEPWAGQSLAEGAAGVALFHIEHAAHGHTPWDIAHRWIRQATDGTISAADTTGLYLGAPALAFVLTTVPDTRRHLYHDALAALHGHVVDLAHRRVDAALARLYRGALATFAEYDAFFGLTGIGAYLLHASPYSSALERVLSYLVSLTQPLDSNRQPTPGWWVDHDPHRRHALPDGHGNLGAAHGITGPLLLLAQAARRGIRVDGQAEAIRTICDHLDAWRQEGETGPWWPEHLTLQDLESGHPHQEAPGRPSWCYGTPSIARAGQLAGIALNDPVLQSTYEDALHQCVNDPVQLARITDTSLCHGWAGLYQTVFRAAHDARSPHLAGLLPALGKNLATHARPAAGKGPGLLEGDAGCALALCTAATAQAPNTGWDRCLLIN